MEGTQNLGTGPEEQWAQAEKPCIWARGLWGFSLGRGLQCVCDWHEARPVVLKQRKGSVCGGRFDNSLRSFCLSQLGGDWGPFKTRRWRPGMLQITLRCTQQSHSRTTWSKVDMPRLGNPGLDQVSHTHQESKDWGPLPNEGTTTHAEDRHYTPPGPASEEPDEMKWNPPCASSSASGLPGNQEMFTTLHLCLGDQARWSGETQERKMGSTLRELIVLWWRPHHARQMKVCLAWPLWWGDKVLRGFWRVSGQCLLWGTCPSGSTFWWEHVWTIKMWNPISL